MEGKSAAAKKILFTSGKGGVGKSTLAASFAKILSSEGKGVLLIDFDVSLRTLDIMLGLGSLVLYDWNDVMEGRCAPLEAIVTNGQGPELLAAPLERHHYTRQQVSELVEAYEPYYDYIIMDSPAGVGYGFDTAMTQADAALLVATPDPVCVRSAAVASDRLAAKDIPTWLIINRFVRKKVENGRALNIDDVIDTTGAQLLGVVPEDPSLAQSAQAGGPVDMRRKASKAIVRILRRMDGERVPLKL